MILAYASYAPARRSADEDPLTMMIAVGRRLLLQDGARPQRLALASMSLPGARRRVHAGLVAEALDLPRSTYCLECTTSARAATEAILALGSGLVLAADGSFAAGVLLGGAPLEARSALAEYPGLDLGAADYDEAAFLDVVRAAAAGMEADILALNPPHPRLARAAAAALGFRDPVLAPEGSGAAGPLLALFAALDRAAPGQRVLLVSYGSGSTADAIVVQKGGR